MRSRSGKPLLHHVPRASEHVIDCIHMGVWDDPFCCTSRKDYVHVDCWRRHYGVGVVEGSEW